MHGAALMLGKGGFLLFVAGLAIGGILPRLRNPRMGLSAHLTAAQTGTALIAVAMFWPQLGVAPWAELPLAISLLASSWLLVAGLVLAAAFGASKALPIAGAGFSASAGKERLVSIATIGSSVWMMLASLGICFFMLSR